MKIDVLRLKDGAVENFKEALTPDEFDLGTSEVKYKGVINLSADVKKDMEIISTKTHISATAQCICSRCLKEFDQNIEKDFDMQYPLDKSQQSIDIAKDIREEMILDYPVKFLCKDDCRGLCTKCGQDLNSGDCNC